MFPLRDDNPTRHRPYVTVGLIGVCVLAFLWQNAQPHYEEIVWYFGLIPAQLLGTGPFIPGAANPLVTVFTSMFLHGGWMHLGGNMLFLWIFGNNIEDSSGHLKFLVFYLLCGVGAALAQVASAPMSEIPMIGASGAVSGVLGAYLLLFPRARVSTLVFLGIFVTIIRLRAWVLLGVWFGGQALQAALTPPGSPGVAFVAHVGGFVAGMVLIGAFKRRGVPWFADGGPRSEEAQKRPIDIRFRRSRKGSESPWRPGPWG